MPEHDPNIPLPDPTVLTTEALMREVESMRDVVNLRIAALAAEMLAKLDGGVSHVEGLIREESEVCNEKFRAVGSKLRLVEDQRVEQKADTKLAVDAALAAQKEAVREQTSASERSIAKSEAATTKAIEQLQATFVTALDGQRREIADLKERITQNESRQQGAGEARHDQSITVGQLIAVAAVGVTALGGIAAVVIAALP